MRIKGGRREIVRDREKKQKKEGGVREESEERNRKKG